MLNIEYIPLPNIAVAYKKTSYYMQPEYITIHNTANIATARGEIDYMHTSNDYRSFHFAVDDTSIVQGLLLNQNGWHAGDDSDGRGNRKSIGIEICLSYVPKKVNGVEVGDEAKWRKSYKKRFEKAQENAAELTAYLLNKYGWGMDRNRIKKHQDFSNKYCPHRTLSDYGWEYFLNLVERKYKEMHERGDDPMTAEEKKEFAALKSKVAALTKAVDDVKVKYNDAGKCPEYSQPTIEKLIGKGHLKGDTKGDLKLTDQMIRTLVILDRAGIFD